jgi:hypothetical protein
MQALAYWKAVTADRSEFQDRLVALLAESGIGYCVIDGQAVNAYPQVRASRSDVHAVSKTHLEMALQKRLGPRQVLRRHGQIQIEAHDQLQTDPRYAAFVAEASPREVLGLSLPVAPVEAVMQGKVWAVQDPGRRPSKRQKDLADIARLLEAYPELRRLVPAPVLARLI